MKKYMTFALMLGMFLLVGCGNQDQLALCRAEKENLIAQAAEANKELEKSQADLARRDEGVAKLVDAVMTEAKNARAKTLEIQTQLDETRKKLSQAQRTIKSLQEKNKKLEKRVAELENK